MGSVACYTLCLCWLLSSIDTGYGYSFGIRQQGLCPTWGDYQACYTLARPNATEQAFIRNERQEHGGFTLRVIQMILEAACRFPANMNRSQRKECLSEKFPNCPLFADLPDTNGGTCTADGHPTDQIIDFVDSFTFLDDNCENVGGFQLCSDEIKGQNYTLSPSEGVAEWTRQHLAAINCILDPTLDVPEVCNRRIMVLSSMWSTSLGVGAYIDLTQFILDS